MKRTNSWQDAKSTGLVRLDAGDGLEIAIPSGRRSYTVSETAGRTVKVWDYLNNREQLIYGDTGWRDVTALCTGVVSGGIYLRRTAHEARLRLSGVKLVEGASILVADGGLLLPFAPDRLDSEDGNVRHANTETLRRVNVSQYGGVRIYGATTSDLLFGTVSWALSRPWPATLPGVARVSI